MGDADIPDVMDSQDDYGADDCLQTQKMSQFSQLLNYRSIEEEELDRKKYATLHPMDRGLNQIVLYTEQFAFGRQPESEYYYDFHELASGESARLLSAVSLKHCHLRRDFVNEKTYLHDTSTYGTFVNEKLIGKGNYCVLQSGDLISICHRKFFVYMYVEGCTKGEDYPPSLTEHYFISNYLIGEGAMGKVFLGKRRSDTSISVAVKVIAKKGLSISRDCPESGFGSSTELIRREAEIMLNIKHPNCVQLEYVCESPRMAYMVMEYLEGGELFSRIIDEKNLGKGLGERLTKFYAWQMLNALKFLHEHNIVHRDIKPENVLLLRKDDCTLLKLSDFGLSKADGNTLETFCGTQCYMAPELLAAKPRYKCEVDMWALGAVLFTCICGYPPFSNDYSDMPLREQILKGRLVYYHVWKGISKRATRLIRKMLRVNISQRLVAAEAIRDPWFNDPIVEKAKEVVRSYAQAHSISSDSIDGSV
uniref:Protein kinase domain-containing protein n=2 Tax=Parascaris univalens TaxID=6257 RepID=A0A915APS3_PARUN